MIARSARLSLVVLVLVLVGLSFVPAGPTVREGVRSRPPPGAVVLFNGKDLSGWVGTRGRPADWRVAEGYLEVVPGTRDIQTRQEFGDCRLHVEFRVPLMPGKTSQTRGNSGVYIQSRYEVQILDSFHNPTYFAGECGALYGTIPVSRNACAPPERWQTFDITFRYPRIEADRVIVPGRLRVIHNGIPVIEDGCFERPTGAARKMPWAARGPIRLQDHGAPVRFRNLWIEPIGER
jgi:hypothetical protein